MEREEGEKHSIDGVLLVPGTGKPGKLPSMGSHAVGHD